MDVVFVPLQTPSNNNNSLSWAHNLKKIYVFKATMPLILAPFNQTTVYVAMSENRKKTNNAENKNLLRQRSRPVISQPSHHISTFSTDHLIIFSPFQ